MSYTVVWILWCGRCENVEFFLFWNVHEDVKTFSYLYLIVFNPKPMIWNPWWIPNKISEMKVTTLVVDFSNENPSFSKVKKILYISCFDEDFEFCFWKLFYQRFRWSWKLFHIYFLSWRNIWTSQDIHFSFLEKFQNRNSTCIFKEFSLFFPLIS